MAMIGGRVLVVDDDEATSALQKKRLERFGHEVECVSVVETAFEKLSSQRYDLLLLDYTLSGDQNGLDFYIILRERGISIPAILVTGFSDERVILRAMRAGVRDFLPKSLEYLEDLPMAVERVLKQASIERQLSESESVREKQEQLKAAFNAARLGYWDWNLSSGVVTWSGFHQELFGFRTGEVLTTFDDLAAQIALEDRDALVAALESAKQTGEQFDERFRVRNPNSGERWLNIKGRFLVGSPREADKMTAVVLDITEAKQAEIELEHSYEQIKSLNERLKLSVTEAHHRVKNSLQTLSSLVNLQRGETDTLSAESVEKIISHLQGFAVVHDALTNRSKEEDGLEVKDIEITPILERVISVVSKLSGERGVITDLNSCKNYRVSDRHASSLAVIVNELFSNALKHGVGRIWISVKREGSGKAILLFENEGSSFPADFSPDKGSRTGLFLLNALCQSDFDTEAKFSNSPSGNAQVSITFPIFNPYEL